jgi:WD40 repeat protein
MSDGFRIWDLNTGAELGFIRSEWGNNCVLFEPSGSLLTMSYGGLSQWPIRSGLNATGELTIGPPESLPLPNGEGLDQSRDGRVTVTCDRAVSTQRPHAGGWILRSDRLTQPIHLDPGADVGQIAVSPDGRWVATSTHVIGLAKIWDARDGRLVKQLAEWGANLPRFSPDGRWLSTTLDGGRLFAVESWKPGPRLGGRAVMSPDSTLAAIGTAGGLRLLESATSREIAVLEEPDLVSIDQALFTPDGKVDYAEPRKRDACLGFATRAPRVEGAWPRLGLARVSVGARPARQRGAVESGDPPWRGVGGGAPARVFGNA